MNAALISSAEKLIELALREDLGERGDITTLALGEVKTTARAQIIAKQEGVLCGVGIIALVFEKLGVSVHITKRYNDGDPLCAGDSIAEIAGSASGILIAERTILNFIGRLSGIASLTRNFVDAVKNTKTKILDTRKTTPGWRLLEKYAVRCGGGVNHRTGLYDMFLLKENHIAKAGGIASAVRACRRYAQEQNINTLIEVETQTIDQVREALSLAVDRIMLDNMTLEQMNKCVEFVAGRVPLEASGNANLKRVRSMAETGVDYISVGALTHSAPIFDFSLLLD